MRTSPAHEVYASLLASTVPNGHAVWYPEHHDSGEVQICDVGYMDDGQFVRLFNTRGDVAAINVTFWNPPFINPEPMDKKSPAIAHITTRDKALAAGVYHSQGVTETQVAGGIQACEHIRSFHGHRY